MVLLFEFIEFVVCWLQKGVLSLTKHPSFTWNVFLKYVCSKYMDIVGLGLCPQ